VASKPRPHVDGAEVSQGRGHGGMDLDRLRDVEAERVNPIRGAGDEIVEGARLAAVATTRSPRAMASSTTQRPNPDDDPVTRVLDAFCVPFPGFFLYYPSRAHIAPKLQALVDFLKVGRPGRARGAR
jgi:DNA-binding transcriptional LysR family regulator